MQLKIEEKKLSRVGTSKCLILPSKWLKGIDKVLVIVKEDMIIVKKPQGDFFKEVDQIGKILKEAEEASKEVI